MDSIQDGAFGIDTVQDGDAHFHCIDVWIRGVEMNDPPFLWMLIAALTVFACVVVVAW